MQAERAERARFVRTYGFAMPHALAGVELRPALWLCDAEATVEFGDTDAADAADADSAADGAADADWAGDRVSRKSTSGGMLFCGRHLVKSWSSNQQVIAMSSGEAELCALTKGATQVLGLSSMGADFGEQLGCTVRSDSSAALAISQRGIRQSTTHPSTVLMDSRTAL